MYTCRKLIVILAYVFATSAAAIGDDVRADGSYRFPQNAEDIQPLRKGDKAPAFTVRTVDDQEYAFLPEDMVRPTVLILFRGGWCPFCNLHLSELRHVIPDVKESGFDVLFISNDPPKLLYKSLKEETQEAIAGLDYTIYSDSNLAVARAFGTAFQPSEKLREWLVGKGSDYEESSVVARNGLSVPAVYVIDTKGEIVFDYVNPDHKVRLPADELLAATQEVLARPRQP